MLNWTLDGMIRKKKRYLVGRWPTLLADFDLEFNEEEVLCIIAATATFR